MVSIIKLDARFWRVRCQRQQRSLSKAHRILTTLSKDTHALSYYSSTTRANLFGAIKTLDTVIKAQPDES